MGGEEGGLPPGITDFNKSLYTDGQQVFFSHDQNASNWRFNFTTSEWEPRITGNLLAFGSNYTVFHSSNGSLRLSTDTGITWQDVGPSNASLVVGALAIEQNTLYVSGFSAQFPGKACLWALDLAAIGSGDAIGGKVFFDDNGDGIPDAGEPGLPYTPLTTAPFETAASTDADGSYGFLFWQTDDTLRAHMPSPYFSSQPAYHILAPPTVEYNFAVVAQPNAVDLCLSAVNHSVFRPGFSTNLTIDISNPGTVGQGGTVTVELPGIFLYENANPVPDNISGNTLTWNLAPVASLGNASIFLQLKTDVSAVAGQAYSIPFTVVAFEPDLNPANNGFQLEGEVVASFDPNDKQCTPASLTPQSAADREPLTYTIRFQNTGNYPASFVRIADTLSTSLDLSTLQVLGSSHPMTYRLYGMGVLEFFFDNINLPDSISDEPGSHGFVQFSIRPKAGLELGDVVENTAFIYFDFNEPVITNTVQTKVEPTSKVSSGEKIGKVNIYPNPTSSSLRLGFDNPSTAELNLLLFDLWGRQLDRQIIQHGSDFFDLNVDELPPAVYFLRLSDSTGRTTWNGKFVKQ
ncbi:MAG: T9SS type A sorting domain-containing protein [Saprospiraceae bacterium]|nr:T9SS type A sorting domain-containing protein [Saprospiraceae bacterium]